MINKLKNIIKQTRLEVHLWRTIKRAAVYFLPVTLFLGMVFFMYFKNYIDNEFRLIKAKEAGHVESLRQTFHNTLESAASDVSVLAWHDDLLDIMENDFLENNRLENFVPLENEFLKFLDKKKLYDQARVIDSQGMEIIRANYDRKGSYITPEDKLQLKANRYYFTESIILDHEEIYISPFDLNVENGQIETPYKPMIRFATPIINANGTKKGIVVLNYYGEILLNKIKHSVNPDAKTLLVNADGYWLVGQNPEDEWGFMFDGRRNKTMANVNPETWKQVVSQNHGQFERAGIIYSYTTVFPYKTSSLITKRVETTGSFLKIVSRLPIDDLNSQFQRFKIRLLILFGLVSLVFAVISWLLALSTEKRKKMTQDREHLIEELRNALENIKTLSGLVPICAKCKKVRDDEGYWNQIESYVEKHSEAQFSHGICEECADELYGDQEWYQKGMGIKKEDG